MARHSNDYYWTDEQRAWANKYLKELNEALSEYELKKKELEVARKEYVRKTLIASKKFRNYSQELQTCIVDSINDNFSRNIDELDDEFFTPIGEVEP